MSLTEDESIGLEIAIRREELGLTQQDLGQRVNRNRHTIGQYEDGQVTIRKTMLRRIAKALKCSVEDFLKPFEGEAFAEPTEDERIGARITAHRERFGWSQEELAKRAEVSRYTVCQYENGNVGHKVDTLRKIAAAIGCQVVDFLEDREGEGVEH